MSEPELKSYFYAEDDAEFYDATVEFTTEAYTLLHQQVERLVGLWKRRRHGLRPPVILDIGAGTGAEAVRILKTVPDARLICVDASPRMLAEQHRKIAAEFGDPSAGGRCESIVADAYANNWLSELVSRLALTLPLDLIVSVYLYHHLTAGEKAPIYKEIRAHLATDGTFIHGDLFSYADVEMAQQAQTLENDWLTNSFSDRAVCAKLGICPAEAARLLARWLQHLREDNRPVPISSSDPNDIETETGLLRRAGFGNIEVPFRLFQNGVIWADA